MSGDLEYIKMSYDGGFNDMPSIIISETDKSQSDIIYINSSYSGKILESEGFSGTVIFNDTVDYEAIDDNIYCGTFEGPLSIEYKSYRYLLVGFKDINITSEEYTALTKITINSDDSKINVNIGGKDYGTYNTFEEFDWEGEHYTIIELFNNCTIGKGAGNLTYLSIGSLTYGEGDAGIVIVDNIF